MRLKQNKPHHGLGLLGHAVDKKPLKANAHVPQRTNSGNSDRHGYQGSASRRNGAHTGSIPPGNTGKPKGAVGNGHGSAPGGRRGETLTPASVSDHGRGGPGKIGGHDGWKGKPKTITDTMTAKQFEALGCD